MVEPPSGELTSQRGKIMYDDRGSRGGGGYRDRPPREMHDVTCAECGVETQVPFKPDGSRPVYCRDCFQKKKPRRY